uniref:NADH dehydrogenase subunit 4L n=1 Tax=Brueelia nebulosa TaxID=2972756 RepID=UPI0023AAA471|nr:NADH dehydrogenase subunit 4L [Brueelia nebulosa]WCF77122.1 NADH dehydrogenase subunit 4L [Brueelia nebulosa]
MFFLMMVGLLKFLSTSKMMIMLMSLEFCSVFMFFLLVIYSFFSMGLSLGTYSVFLVLLVCESVLVLVGMVNIFRKGSLMVSSTFILKL